ncbi:ankyrin and het domain protein [Paraphaeosphaeria sporulosa]
MLNDMTQHSYPYEPLKTKDSFRVLELLPGILDDPLQCRIRETIWSPDTKYEALSYVWGPPIFPMSMEETSSVSILWITENLFHALRILRYKHMRRTLWVDAICINQSDNVEKGHQVALMGNIYRKAQSVVVWLGREDCDEAVDLLEELGQNYAKYGVPDTVNGKPVTSNDDTVASRLELLFHPRGGSLKAFFERPYFERVWVKQEFALAKMLWIRTGHRTLHYERFRKAVHVLWILRDQGALLNQEESSAGVFGSLLLSGLTAMRATFDKLLGSLQMGTESQSQSQAPSIHRAGPTNRQVGLQNTTFRLIDSLHENPTMLTQCYALILFRDIRSISEPPDTRFDLLSQWKMQFHAKCSNERDRLFGLLGLANAHSIVPDYESPIEEVWHSITPQYLRADDLVILNHARGLPKGSGEIADTPSFVPNFAAADRHKPICMAYGTNKFSHDISHSTARNPPVLLDGRFPELPGVLADHVIRVTEQVVSRKANEEVGIDWESLGRSCDEAQQWVTSVAWPYNESVVCVLARTLIANNFFTASDLPYPDSWICVAFVLFLLGPWKTNVEDTAAKVATAEEILGGPLLSTIQAIYPDYVPYDPETGVCMFEELLDRLDEEALGYAKFGVLPVMIGRVLFLSSKGYLGIGPEQMRESDWVIIPDGAYSPFAVRPTGSRLYENQGRHSSTVQVVGDCYLHGWMEGDLFGTVETGNGDDEVLSESGPISGCKSKQGTSANTLERGLFVLC